MSSIFHLIDLARKKERRILGLMSGTSLDGLDLALVQFSGSGNNLKFNLENFTTVPYSDSLRKALQEQMIPENSRVDQICSLNIGLGKYFGEQILEVLGKWRISTESVDCVASHGQTLYHIPRGKDWDGKSFNSTLQIGDGDQIAAITGILTIYDFRTGDIAAGGEGAPLIPYADYILFSCQGVARILHNLGGISNLTYLPSSANPDDIMAFDTGPANVLINLAVTKLIDSTLTFDKDGYIASQSKPHPQLLEKLLNNPFFSLSPPKSTGRELFGAEYLEMVCKQSEEWKLSPVEIVATLTALTGHSIRLAYEKFIPKYPVPKVYFSGGGIHNQKLMRLIRKLLPWIEVHYTEELGINPDAREAISFALFANELLSGNSVVLPGITGSKKKNTLGKISLP